MTHVRRFWLVITGLAIACGGRTMVGGEAPGSDGGVAEDAPRADAPIVGEDGPIRVEDGGGPPDSSLLRDVIFPSDTVIVPPLDVRPPSDVVIVPPPLDVHVPTDGHVSTDGGLPDVVIIPPIDAHKIDSGPPDSSEPVLCGTEVCSSSDECCVGHSGFMITESCVPMGECDAGISLECTGSDNCPSGDVCCGTYTGGLTGSSTCEPGPCPHGTFQLCTTAAECPTGDTCFTTPLGIGICRP
jgi:hypothetical protein